MIEIETARGLIILADDEDWGLLGGLNWCAVPVSRNRFYANARLPGTGKRILMHRLIMDARKGTHVHHINGNGLDNRRENLKVLTPAQHRSAHSPERSGVYFDKAQGRFRASVRIDRNRVDLGLHDDKEVALRAVSIARHLMPGLQPNEMRATANRIKYIAKMRGD